MADGVDDSEARIIRHSKGALVGGDSLAGFEGLQDRAERDFEASRGGQALQRADQRRPVNPVPAVQGNAQGTPLGLVGANELEDGFDDGFRPDDNGVTPLGFKGNAVLGVCSGFV